MQWCQAILQHVSGRHVNRLELPVARVLCVGACRGYLGRKETRLRYIDTVMEYAVTKNYDGCVWAFNKGYYNLVDRNGNTLLHHAACAGRCVECMQLPVHGH